MSLELKENNANRGKRAFYEFSKDRNNTHVFSATREVRPENMEVFDKPLGRINPAVEAIFKNLE